MTRTICCRACVLLLVCALFAAPALAAGEQQGPARAAKEPVSLFAWFWQAFGDLLPSTAKSHGGMDPDGNPLPGTTATSPESGTGSTGGDAHAGMDPDGRT